jgi:hypothetical protein
MLQAVAALISLLVGVVAINVIVHVLREDRDAVLAALGIASGPSSIAPLPPRFRTAATRRGATTRLTPPARVRAAL